jgi:hypothetical protein
LSTPKSTVSIYYVTEIVQDPLWRKTTCRHCTTKGYKSTRPHLILNPIFWNIISISSMDASTSHPYYNKNVWFRV